MNYGAKILFLSLSYVMVMGIAICSFFEAQARSIYCLSQQLKCFPKEVAGFLLLFFVGIFVGLVGWFI